MRTMPVVVRGCRTAPVDDLLEALSTRGWCPSIRGDLSPDARPAPELVTAPGLLSLDGDPAPAPGALEALLTARDREWIALLPASDRIGVLAGQPALADCLFAHQTLPGDPAALDTLLAHAADRAALRVSLSDARRDAMPSDAGEEYEMVGTTAPMLRLFARIRKAAAVDAPILIRGETGTGKELAARGAHERSPRAEGAFIALNCGALPGELVQSELFGHEKGAFTGAVGRHTGRIEAASGGTLFLDEIGDLPLAQQTNLLRFLESGVVQRVGGTGELPVDVRVVAATRVDLEAAIADGVFREDLYHRLNVLQIEVPPLRERPDDIEVLARFFFDRFAAERAPGLAGISHNALHVMRHYAWPGNVRELINRMRRAMVMAESRLLQPADLGLERRQGTRRVQTLEEVRDRAERAAIRAALARNGQRIARAARDLGVSRMTLYRLMDKYDLRGAART